MIRDRLKTYERRTGILFPLNVLAKFTTAIGIATMAYSMHENLGPKEGLVSAGLILGGLALDKATGGLQPYPKSSESLRNQ